MSRFLRSPYIKVLCFYLALFVAGLIHVPEIAWASFIFSQSEEIRELDQEPFEVLQTFLEHELIAEKLSELGLSTNEIIQRIEQLSPEERDAVLANLEMLQKGGDVEAWDQWFVDFFENYEQWTNEQPDVVAALLIVLGAILWIVSIPVCFVGGAIIYVFDLISSPFHSEKNPRSYLYRKRCHFLKGNGVGSSIL